MKGRLGPTAIIIAVTAIMVGSYFFEVEFLSVAAAELSVWAIIVSGFALAVSAMNLLNYHFRNMTMNRESRLDSAVLILALFGMAISGIFFGRSSSVFSFLFNRMMLPVGSAMISLVVFYIASAAYRVFRAKNVYGTALLAATLFVLLGKAPASVAVWDAIPKFAEWIMSVPNTAGQRAFVISAAVGSMATGLRVILGLERRYGS